MFQPQVLVYGLLALMGASLSQGASLPRLAERSTALAARASTSGPVDFTGASWIWNSELDAAKNAPPGTRPFRKDFTAPAGKIAEYAEILITTDNGLVLYVNGAEIGTGGDFRFAERFCVKLEACDNVFAVAATNADVVPNPAGVLAAIRITYTDGTNDTIVTDASWRTNTVLPTGFEQPSYDVSSWPTAVVEGVDGDQPWGVITVPTDPPTMSFTKSSWIWTNEIDAAGNAPIGARAFRRTFTVPSTHIAVSANIIIATDNEYTLYVNGTEIGSTTTDWTVAGRYVVDLLSDSEVVFAVYAVNTGGPAGLLAEVEITMAAKDCNCTGGAYFISDSSWKVSTTVPTGFQLTSFDDSSWSQATVEAAYRAQPWGNIPVPSTISPHNGPVSGAPA